MATLNPFRVLPWYQWPLIPIIVPSVAIILVLMMVRAMPREWLYPERSVHAYDIAGSAAKKARLGRWRDAYGKLPFTGRVYRLFMKPGGKRWRRTFRQ